MGEFSERIILWCARAGQMDRIGIGGSLGGNGTFCIAAQRIQLEHLWYELGGSLLKRGAFRAMSRITWKLLQVP
jgi:hypothetical protein